MTLDFFLFDVDHGQCAAVKMPNGNWCIFDAGRRDDYSPIEQIQSWDGINRARLRMPLFNTLPVSKTTISHLHADHFDDIENLIRCEPAVINTVLWDDEYIADAASTTSHGSFEKLLRLITWFNSGNPLPPIPDYGDDVFVSELCLSVEEARSLGGDANTRVNNASIITRIDFAGRSILICGDMMTIGWEYCLTDPFQSNYWIPHVSNIDVLVAPHHGHMSGFSSLLMTYAVPDIVLVSIESGDDHIAQGYQNPLYVKGRKLPSGVCRSITTRNESGFYIRLSIAPPEIGALVGTATFVQQGFRL